MCDHTTNISNDGVVPDFNRNKFNNFILESKELKWYGNEINYNIYLIKNINGSQK